MKEEWKAATTRDVNALKAVEEPMFMSARRKFISMVKAIDQSGRAEAGWIYIFLRKRRGLLLVRAFFFFFPSRRGEGGRGKGKDWIWK